MSISTGLNASIAAGDIVRQTVSGIGFSSRSIHRRRQEDHHCSSQPPCRIAISSLRKPVRPTQFGGRRFRKQ